MEDAIGQKLSDGKPRHVPEYLVCFDTLQRIALEYGLVLEKKMNFHEYYSQAVHGDTASHKLNQKLLESMVTKREEVHRLTQEQRNQQWEISGLYCVFIFRKQNLH